MSNTSESKVLVNLYDCRDMWNDFFIDHIVKLKTPENAELIKKSVAENPASAKETKGKVPVINCVTENPASRKLEVLIPT